MAAIVRCALIGVLLFWMGMTHLSFSEEIRYLSGDRRDPFVPVNRSAAAPVAFMDIQIEGIIYDPKGKSLVMIEGEPYQVGDSVGAQKILAIYPSKIEVFAKNAKKAYLISIADQELLLESKK